MPILYYLSLGILGIGVAINGGKACLDMVREKGGSAVFGVIFTLGQLYAIWYLWTGGAR